MPSIEDFHGEWTVRKIENLEEPHDPHHDLLLDVGDTFTIGNRANVTRVTRVRSTSNRPGGDILPRRRWRYGRKSKTIKSEFDYHGKPYDIVVCHGIASPEDVAKGRAKKDGSRTLAIDIDSPEARRMHKGTYHAEG